MNKKTLVKAIAAKCGTSVKLTQQMLSATIDTMADELRSGENITLLGFGTFRIHTHNARTGFNPLSRTTFQIPETKTVKFKLSKNIVLDK